jgi:AcrR family transcriptional regulator
VADPNAPAQANLPRAEQRRLGIVDATLGATTYYFESRDEMVLEAFRFYINRCMSDLTSLERELSHLTPESLVDLAVEFTHPGRDIDHLRRRLELVLPGLLGGTAPT